MPIVRVTMGAGRTPEQKMAVARDLTEALMRHCGAEAANINILFEDVELDQWIVGNDAVDWSKDDPDKS